VNLTDSRIARGLGAWVLLLVAGCAVGPDYKRPEVAAPAAYSEKGPWKVAQPKDALPKDGWWTMFADPELDRLEAKAIAASPTLRAALARFDQALAAARLSRSALYPSLSIGSDSFRERFSANRQSEVAGTTFAYTTNSFDLPLELSYQLDLFGQVRRSVESATAAAQAQGAAYQNVLLALQSGVAQNYFTLRSLATQRELLQRNVGLLSGALDLVRKLRKGGANSDLDVYQAEAELATVEDAAAAADQASAQQRHALAVLVGENPEGFSIEARPLDATEFTVPVGMPSELLERRPDVAAAERTMAATNARIGVAKAAFFPSIGLTAFAGANSSQLDNLLTWSSREWAAGPFLSVPIFNGGANTANYRQAQAAYDEAVANYRQQVLVAFQEVEDGLSDMRILARQADILGRAVTASTGATNLSTIRYKAGLVSYIEVIDSQRTQLQSELSLAQARAARLSATVMLVQALGGGW
jgi:multidrug efflux system outer membrane protein